MALKTETKFKLKKVENKLSPFRFISGEELKEKLQFLFDSLLLEIPEPIKGDIGLQGKLGLQGKDGVKGKDGKRGADGIGINGINGKDGIDGIDGKEGISPTIQDILEALEPEIEILRRELRRRQTSRVGGGGDSMNFQNVTSSINIPQNVKLSLVDATLAKVTVTLPNVAQAARREYHIKKTDSSTNVVSIKPLGSETIDGENCQDIGRQFTSRRLYSDGKNWHLI